MEPFSHETIAFLQGKTSGLESENSIPRDTESCQDKIIVCALMTSGIGDRVSVNGLNARTKINTRNQYR